MDLGSLDSVDVRTIWRNESAEFTPWLATQQNLDALGHALRLGPLSLRSVEKDIGDFSADIVAVDETGAEVLIENQLETTDHRHLGQVMTYLAGLDSESASVVWISTQFREEHRAAIDWINRQTGEGFDFFGVEIEVVKIDDSRPAARFNVVAMPNGWSKQARIIARRNIDQNLTETGALFQDYWVSLREVMDRAGSTRRFPKAWSNGWLPFSIGRTGFELRVTLQRNEKRVRIELYMHQTNIPPKCAFRALLALRGEIEAAYGAALDWQELPASIASRIAVYFDNADIADRSDWPRQQQWIYNQLKCFRSVFAQRIEALKLDETLE